MGRKLRELREAVPLTVVQAIAALEWSKPRLWRYETGQVPIHPNDVDVMCRIYGADAELTESLKALSRETRSRGWWHAYSEIPEWFQLFLGMEAAAHRVRQYEAEIIPGLLQSLPYARAILGQSVTTPTGDQIEQQSRVRMQRQRILTRSAPRSPMLDVILSEAALLRGFDRVTMVDQLTALLTLAERPNVAIRIAPLSAGSHKAYAGPFVILDFPRESPARDPEPTTVYVELPTGALYLDKASEVAAYEAIWLDLADRVALDEAESRRLIEQRVEEWSR
ncbi:helix-turn-helix domain-containing protein [Actinoplanes bogorensis]|uniref:Helix-turn-helix domain-containing protein n=1 Tax=Paractinoplanes bogorensis TaxID=1610840 RepID=A0ABS5YVA0_9ACTN|nr:helix-turn-helix domain-containing protein [Actinoplanes bogorensis]